MSRDSSRSSSQGEESRNCEHQDDHIVLSLDLLLAQHQQKYKVILSNRRIVVSFAATGFIRSEA